MNAVKEYLKFLEDAENDSSKITSADWQDIIGRQMLLNLDELMQSGDPDGLLQRQIIEMFGSVPGYNYFCRKFRLYSNFTISS